MNISISNSSGKPIYEQITSQIKNLIITGELQSGDPLPSLRFLAKELRISVISTKRAYEDLERDGFIESVAGKGSFVADSSRMRAGKLKEWKGRFTAFVEEGIKIGVTAEDMTGLVEETFCGRMAGLVEETFCGHMTERGDGHD